MAKTSEHGRIIATAAKSALAPIGCIRKGQSRVWYSDQRYWVIAVEFQPSGWSKGSYLNIHVAWLWKEGRGYAHSYRPVDFIPFVTAAQFAPLITEMAAVAVHEVLSVRKQFKSFSDICAYIAKSTPRDCWQIYYTAVATGLAGDFFTAQQYFEKLAAWSTHGYAWEEKLKKDSAALAVLVDQPSIFRSTVLTIIEKRRQLMRLPPDLHCLDVLDSIPAP